MTQNSLFGSQKIMVNLKKKYLWNLLQLSMGDKNNAE